VVAAASQLRGHLVAISYSRSREIDDPAAPELALRDVSSSACSIAIKQAFNRAGAVGSYLKQCPNNKRDSSAMTPYLIAARTGIILWVTLALVPVEITFDCLEAELERRRVLP